MTQTFLVVKHDNHLAREDSRADGTVLPARPWMASSQDPLGRGGPAGPSPAAPHIAVPPVSSENAMRSLCERENPPGVITCRDGVPVGWWCSVGPRAEIPQLATSKRIRPVDELPVWSIICVVVRSGHRRQGVTVHLLEGAVDYAASRGAPAIEAYPVDPDGRMDTTMTFVCTRSTFKRSGYSVIATAAAVAIKMPRLILRLDL